MIIFFFKDVQPKDFYKRQILQPIPGYIPVYIQSDEDLSPRQNGQSIKSHKSQTVEKNKSIQETNKKI